MKDLIKKYVTLSNVIGVIVCIAFPPLILGLVMQGFDNANRDTSKVSCSSWVNNQSSNNSKSII